MKTRPVLFFVTGLLALLVSACQAAPASPPAAAAPGAFGDLPAVVLFISDRDGAPAYYSMALDGSRVQKIPTPTLPAGFTPDQPVWSPALQRYLFTAQAMGNSDIFSMKADGSDPRNLTNTPTIFEGGFAAAPDGSAIAYVSADAEPDIWLMKPDGSQQINLTRRGGHNGEITWLPDSSRIFFSSNRSSLSNVFSMKPDGSDIQNASQGRNWDGAFSLSMDGQKLAFDSDRDPPKDIYVVQADGSGTAVNLTNNPAQDVEPLWSPDGQKIAFRSNRDGDWHVFVMNADGSQPRNLTAAPQLNARTLSWTPDSLGLVLAAPVKDRSQILILKLDGSAPINLTNNAFNNYSPIVVRLK